MRDVSDAAAPEGLAAALAREIADHLARLLETGEAAAIDLRSLPMSAEDRAALDAFLGEGEVRAEIDAAGRSELAETRFTGVWRARHFDGTGREVMAEILITPIPDILRADPADMRRGRDALLGALDDDPSQGDSDAQP